MNIVQNMFMSRSLISEAAFLLCLISCVPPTNEKTISPDIVFIIADDLAWHDLGCYGHPHIRTPNIDRLAAEGMLFERAYVTASSCSPSRCSIITGKYPHQTNAEQLHWPLPADQITFTERLREAGYWVGQAGKWHMGDAIKDRFDKIMEVSVSGFQLQPDGTMVVPRNESGCEDWIPLLDSRDRNKPFFLWLAAVDPHRDYREYSVGLPHETSDVVLPPYFPDSKESRTDLALYYDEISRLDSFVGLFTAALKEQNLEKNTLVLFISDNGRPFPREKTTLYEGGIKTPWIVKWPEKIRAGTTTKSLVSAVDIAPTFLSIANVSHEMDLEGIDISPILMDHTLSLRTNIYAEDHWHDFEDYARAICTEKYKYIKNFYTDLPNTPSADALRSPTYQEMIRRQHAGILNVHQMACFITPRPEEELYDLSDDPHELTNLIDDDKYQAVIDELRMKLSEIRNATKDVQPQERTPDEFDRKSGKPNAFRKRPRPSKAQMGL